MKWRIITFWTDESRLPKPGAYREPVGAWNRVKRHLMRKWTKQIKVGSRHPGDTGADELEPIGVRTAAIGNKGANSKVKPLGRAAVMSGGGVAAPRVVVNQIHETRQHQWQSDPEIGKEGPDIFQEDVETGRSVPVRMMGMDMDMEAGFHEGERNSGVMVEERREGPDVSEEDADIISLDTDPHL